MSIKQRALLYRLKEFFIDFGNSMIKLESNGDYFHFVAK